MPKLPQSAANFYLNQRARGVPRKQALVDVVRHLETSDNPEYRGAAPIIMQEMQDAGDDENNLRAIADSIVNHPRLDRNEAPGYLPTQPGEVAQMQRSAGAQSAVSDVARVAVPMAAGMGTAAALSARGMGAAAPWVSAAVQGLTQGGMDLAAGRSAGDAATSGAITTGANVWEEGTQQALQQVPARNLVGTARALKISPQVLATLSPMVLSALNNLLIQRGVSGQELGAGDVGLGVLGGIPAVARVKPNLIPGMQNSRDIGPGTPVPFMVEEGTQGYRNLIQATKHPASENFMRAEIDAQDVAMQRRLTEMFPDMSPDSPEMAYILNAIRTGAARELELPKAAAELQNSFQQQRVDELNRGLSRSTTQAQRSVAEEDQLRYDTQMAQRRMDEARLKAEADATNRANAEAYAAEKANWERLQQDLRAAEETKAIGQQVGVARGLPQRGVPAALFEETANIANAPGQIPEGGIVPPANAPTPGELGLGADKIYRGGIAQARDIAEGNFQRALDIAGEVESRSPEKTAFSPKDQAEWLTRLRGIQARFKTILASDQGQMGKAYFKVRELADMLDRALGEGKTMTARGNMELYREINKAMPWEGDKLALVGDAGRVAAELRGGMLDLIQGLGEKMPSLIPAINNFNRGRQQHASAYGAEYALSKIPGSKQEWKGLPGEKAKVVGDAAKFGKGIGLEGEDPITRRQEFDRHIENMLTTTGMGKDSLPKIAELSDAFNAQLWQDKVAKMLKPGTFVTEDLIGELRAARDAVSRPETAQNIDHALKQVEGLFNGTKLDPKKATRTMFVGGEDFSGEVALNFEKEVLPQLSLMPKDKQDSLWSAVLQHRLAKAGASKKVLQGSDIESILSDSIVAQAPASLKAALQALAERKLPAILSGKIPEFTKAPPAKVEADTAQLGPMPYSPDVPPDVITPKLAARKVEPEKVPMGETLLRMKDLAKIDDLHGLFTDAAISGVKGYGGKFLKTMESFVGKEGWNQVRLGWMTKASRDPLGRIDPEQLLKRILDPNIPEEVKHNLLFKSKEDYDLTVGMLRNVEVPVSKMLRTLNNQPSESTMVFGRRIGAIVQFLKATGAGMTGGAIGGPMLGAPALAAGLFLGVIQPRAFARQLLHQPTMVRRAFDLMQKFNTISGNIPSRTGASIESLTGEQEKPRIRGGSL